MKLKYYLVRRFLCMVPLALASFTGAAAPIVSADSEPTPFVAANGASDGSLGELMMLENSGAAGETRLPDNRPATLETGEPAMGWIASASSLLGPTALALLGLVLSVLGILRKRRP
jgi:hypothetical protein